MFERPAGDPAKAALVARLKASHPNIGRLNEIWGTAYASWEALLQTGTLERTDANNEDCDSMMEHYASAYYRLCRDTMRKLMPNHLYLGSRIHSCPPAVARAAAEFVDVYSANHYWNRAGTATLPKDKDVPVLITEFHFGALDQGVPGCGLVSIHDQTQRGRAYQNYVVSGLMHPQVVGAHWFAWADQSSAGRPGENYQIGFVDVTDTPYPEFITACRRLGDQLYAIRSGPNPALLQVLTELHSEKEGKPALRAKLR